MNNDPGAPRRSGGRGRSPRDERRRTLSQNFLHPSAARGFLNLVDPDPDLLCIEVGAGEGVLTVPLAGICSRVVAYEIDETVAGTLVDQVAALPTVDVVVGDFLATEPPDEPFQVTGNLPFSLTSAIIDWCLAAPGMTETTIISQLEYAKKRSGAYGRWSLLTVLSWPEFGWALLGRISKTQFRPVPRVDAGVLRIGRRSAPLLAGNQLPGYWDLVEFGFTGVGGSLFASLRQRYPRNQLSAAFRAAQVDPDTVVAFVHPDQWLKLFARLHPGEPALGGGRGRGSPGRGRGRRNRR